MKRLLLSISLVFFWSPLFAQSPADSVTLTFRHHAGPSATVYVPGQFNGWIPNQPISMMSYDSGYGGWVKTYTFKIHDPSLRTPPVYLADSVWQYKFNVGGGSGGWLSDPLNPEQNAADNNNSVLRMTTFFWFEFLGTDSSQHYTRMTVGLVHSNSDSVTSIRFETAPTETDSLTVLDVTGQFNRVNRILSFTLPTAIPRNDYFRLVAYNQLGDSIVYKKIGYNVKSLPMPGYAKRGVTLPSPASGDSVTFRIDPVTARSIVLVRIAPAGQSPTAADPIVMHKSVSSSDWWRNVSLSPGTYEYIYEFEDGKRIYDPWGRWNGDQGTRFTIGPAGLTADDYVWGSTGYQRPPLNRLVIYELNVGELAGGYFGKAAGEATFTDLISVLPHLNSLGINAIELMPINDYGIIGRSGFSWGYDISHHFALEPAYGTPREFKELVDSAHARGMAVIVDAVFNHLNDPGPLWQMLQDEATNPFFKLHSDLRPNEDGLVFFRDMDHWSPQTQEYVYDVLKMWVETYRVDGFRYDYTQGIGWVTGDTTVGILGWAKRIKNEYGGTIYQIAEHLPESPALIYYSGLTGGWHDSFRDEIFDEARFQNRSMSNLEDLVLGLGAYSSNDNPNQPSRYADRTQPINANVTHDEQSLIYEMTTFQGVSESDAILRDRLYAVFMFTSLGIPMLWQGMEYAESRGWQSDGQKLSYRPVNWSLASTPTGRTQYRWYKALAYHRRYNPALYQGTLRTLGKYESEKVLVWTLDDTLTATRVTVAANLSGTDRILTNVPWPEPGSWYDIFDQSVLTVSDTPLVSLSLPRYSARVFSNKSDAMLNIPVFVENEKQEGLPTRFSLSQNYPNPFNPQTVFRVDLPEGEAVLFKIYNMLGEEVVTLIDDVLSEGIHSISWNGTTKAGSHATTGVYFARIQAGPFVQVRKIILLR